MLRLCAAARLSSDSTIYPRTAPTALSSQYFLSSIRGEGARCFSSDGIPKNARLILIFQCSSIMICTASLHRLDGLDWERTWCDLARTRLLLIRREEEKAQGLLRACTRSETYEHSIGKKKRQEKVKVPTAEYAAKSNRPQFLRTPTGLAHTLLGLLSWTTIRYREPLVNFNKVRELKAS